MDIVREFTEAHLAYWDAYEHSTALFSAPAEREVGIEPALAVITNPIDEQDLGVPCIRVAWKPNELDVAALAHGGTIWLSCWGSVPVHMLEVQPPEGPDG